MHFWKKKSNTRLIVGLGNPGRDYVHNRHNIGFICLKHFAATQGIRITRNQCQSQIGSGKLSGSALVLAKPQTYMNRSGEAVKALVKKYKVAPDNIIVIQDDLDLSSGKIRIRQGGSSAGHKGIESIITHLGSPDFARIRVGIGRPPEASEADIIDFVLSNFTTDEWATMKQVIPQVSDAIHCLLTESLTTAMNKYN